MTNESKRSEESGSTAGLGADKHSPLEMLLFDCLQYWLPREPLQHQNDDISLAYNLRWRHGKALLDMYEKDYGVKYRAIG